MEFQMSILRDLIYEGVAHGINFQQLCRKAGVTVADLNDSERMIDWEFAPNLWEDMMSLSGDEMIGLHMGTHMRPTSYGMIGYLLQSCKTVKTVMEMVCKYNDTFSTIYKYHIEYQGDLAGFYMEPDALWSNKYPISARQAADIGKSSALHVLRTLTGRKITPVRALLTHPKIHPQAYQKVLECELTFNAPRDGLLFHKADLDIQVLSYDVSLFALFDKLLQEKKERLASTKTFAEEIRMAILSGFKGQIPPIEAIAAYLNTNTRTFQRRLSAEGNNYRAICNELRKELALAMMERSHKSITDIAEMLGYADHTSFRRAFKTWTNALPGDIRKNTASRRSEALLDL
ncbi:MAG: AraC family transcriptional regulator [Dyadobacter fermentans]